MSGISIRRAGLTVVSFTILGKLVGFLREVIVAAEYGTTHVVDVYLAGVTIPALLGGVLFYALPNAFVPMFSGDRRLQRRARRYAILLIASSGVISLALLGLAPWLAILTSKGFPDNLRAETVTILRITAAAVVLFTIEALIRSRLLAKQKFAQSSAASLFPSLTMIAVVVFVPEGLSRTLAWGMVAGTLLSAIWNWLPLSRDRNTEAFGHSWASDNAPQAFALRWVIVVIVIDVIRQAYAVIDRYFASELSTGSIAALQYADLGPSSAIAVCGTALGVAVFPFLADCFHRGDAAAAAALINKAVRWSILGAVPVAIGLAIYNREIVSLLFERGAFDTHSREMTAPILRVYAIGIVPGVVGTIAARALYSEGRWRPLLLAMVAGFVFKCGLSGFWVAAADAQGLAWATVTSTIVVAAIMCLRLSPGVLRRYFGGWLWLTIATGMAYTVGCFATQAVLITGDVLRLPMTLLGPSAGTVVGSLLLLWAGPRLGVPEMSVCRNAISRLILRRD